MLVWQVMRLQCRQVEENLVHGRDQAKVVERKANDVKNARSSVVTAISTSTQDHKVGGPHTF